MLSIKYLTFLHTHARSLILRLPVLYLFAQNVVHTHTLHRFLILSFFPSTKIEKQDNNVRNHLKSSVRIDVRCGNSDYWRRADWIGCCIQVMNLIVFDLSKLMNNSLRLTQLKQDDWVLVDADKQPGGLAGSFKTPEGFRFDHGYMVIPTRYEYIQKLLAELGPPAEGEKKTKEFIDFIEKVRNNFVYIRGNLVKYPIQNNLSGLPPKEQADSVADLMKAQLLLKHIPEDAPKPNNLGKWWSL